MEKEELLGELNDLLRTIPPRAEIRNDTDENLSWLGRALAIISEWDKPSTIPAQHYLNKLQNPIARDATDGFNGLRILLHQARHDLMMRTTGPLTIAVPALRVFDYFDEIRKVVSMAQRDVLFVDPYLDAEFVSRYLPHISTGVRIRLLAREKIQTLLPSAQAFAKQNQAVLEIRTASKFHDRYVFVDDTACYHSGSSFKDGARTAPTTITQITDAFAAVLETYEKIWQSAKIEL